MYASCRKEDWYAAVQVDNKHYWLVVIYESVSYSEVFRQPFCIA